MLAVELYLDHESESRVRSLWDAIDRLGVTSLGSAPGGDYQPHVSLAVFEDVDISTLTSAFEPVVTSCVGLPVTFASLGFFPGVDSVAFLSVTPTDRLLAAHRQVHAALSLVAAESWSIYEPGFWVPHCTLAMSASHSKELLAAVESKLPIAAVAAEVHIVEISSGLSRARLA